MYNIYRDEDYKWIKELMLYPQTLEKNLSYFKDTSQITIPEDPIEKVIFQDKAKKAIRKSGPKQGTSASGRQTGNRQVNACRYV